METNVTLLNFDGAYSRQSFYRNKQYNWVDYESMSNISLFCEKDNLKELTDKISAQNGRGIYYLGSGNYHYISYILQSQIDKPYSLVLFDHHTDTIPSLSDDLISCGSWVLESLQHLPMLEKVYIIGVSEEANNHIPRSIEEKTVFYTNTQIRTNFSTILKSILNKIPTDSVYISMDKDVLNKKEAVTGWDHGTLNLKQMLKMVKALFQTKDIIGVDVCGEYPVSPSNEYQKEVKEAIATNNRSNGIILEYITQWIGKYDKTHKLLHA